jgi:hypothetical protein
VGVRNLETVEVLGALNAAHAATKELDDAQLTEWMEDVGLPLAVVGEIGAHVITSTPMHRPEETAAFVLGVLAGHLIHVRRENSAGGGS